MLAFISLEDLTSSPQKLSVKITLNSTWLDLHARIVIDFSMPDVFTFDYLLQSFEKACVQFFVSVLAFQSFTSLCKIGTTCVV